MVAWLDGMKAGPKADWMASKMVGSRVLMKVD